MCDGDGDSDSNNSYQTVDEDSDEEEEELDWNYNPDLPLYRRYRLHLRRLDHLGIRYDRQTVRERTFPGLQPPELPEFELFLEETIRSRRAVEQVQALHRTIYNPQPDPQPQPPPRQRSPVRAPRLADAPHLQFAEPETGCERVALAVIYFIIWLTDFICGGDPIIDFHERPNRFYWHIFAFTYFVNSLITNTYTALCNLNLPAYFAAPPPVRSNPVLDFFNIGNWTGLS